MIRRSSRLGTLLQLPTFTDGASRLFSSSSAIHSQEPRDEEYADVDWDNLGFSLLQTEYMYVNKCRQGNKFQQPQLTLYGNIPLHPAASVLNYGQGLLEGTKAYRGDDGRVVLFRPDQNAIRMQIGAERMCMSAPSVEQFVEAVKQTTLANKRWIPPAGKGSLYLRPLLIGSGPILGLAPAPEFTFLVYASPVGNYFKGKTTDALNIYVEDEYHRATPGGAGGIKSISNYSPVFRPITKAKERGFSDVLYLDSVHKRYIEEVSSCNVFIVKENVISTPATTGGTILEGITRKSIIQIARDLGYQVEEGLITVEELMKADEVFSTGTAVGVASIGSVTYQGKRVEYKKKKDGEELISDVLYSTLVGIQRGKIEDKWGWVVQI